MNCDHVWESHTVGEHRAHSGQVMECGCIAHSAFTEWRECESCGASNHGTHYSSWTDTYRCDEGH